MKERFSINPVTPHTMKKERRHDLDWIRVIVFDLLILYHVGMLFVPEWGYHLKNNVTHKAFFFPIRSRPFPEISLDIAP